MNGTIRVWAHQLAGEDSAFNQPRNYLDRVRAGGHVGQYGIIGYDAAPRGDNAQPCDHDGRPTGRLHLYGAWDGPGQRVVHVCRRHLPISIDVAGDR
jgi:hypothetical protein